MTLKIDRQTSGDRVVVQLTGNLGVEYLAEVKAQISVVGYRAVVDLGELTLVSVEAIRFLNACEDDGVVVINASRYVSEWMTLERNIGQTPTRSA